MAGVTSSHKEVSCNEQAVRGETATTQKRTKSKTRVADSGTTRRDTARPDWECAENSGMLPKHGGQNHSVRAEKKNTKVRAIRDDTKNVGHKVQTLAGNRRNASIDESHANPRCRAPKVTCILQPPQFCTTWALIADCNVQKRSGWNLVMSSATKNPRRRKTRATYKMTSHTDTTKKNT